jgi:hypothetical protein
MALDEGAEVGAFRYSGEGDTDRLSRDVSTNEAMSLEDSELYMLSWEKIEKAKRAHSSSKFERASKYYEEASGYLLHTRGWKNQAHLFLAESLLEKVEILSLKDETRSAIELLEKSKSHLFRFIAESRKKMGDEAFAFNDLASELIVFCEARIFLESSKQFYRKGDVEHSNEALRKAGASFEELASSNLLSDLPRVAELRSMALLCDALEKFQRAPIDEDPQLYLVAREKFEKAAELTRSRSLKPLLLGLANFSAFLFDSKEMAKSLESTFNVDALARCNEELESATSMFKKIGNKPFLNMLRSSKHILDATINMAAAEREIERPDVKRALYSRAKRSLSLASKYYGVVGPSKRDESLEMIGEVKNQQKLIPLARDIIAEVAANEVMYAEIAESSAMKESTYDGSLEESQVLIEPEFEKTFLTPAETAKLTFTVSNLAREPCTLLRIDEAIPDDFEIVYSEYRVSDGHSIVLDERLEPGSSFTLKIHCRANATGEFVWRPSLIYANGAKNYKASRSQIAQRAIVESSSLEHFHLLVAQKQTLERCLEELMRAGNLPETRSRSFEEKFVEEAYSLRVRIAEIEEEFERGRTQLGKLEDELRRVESDLVSIETRPESVEREEERINLEEERRLVIERLERWRAVLSSTGLSLEKRRFPALPGEDERTRILSRGRYGRRGRKMLFVRQLFGSLGRVLRSLRIRKTTEELLWQGRYWAVLSGLSVSRAIRDLSTEIAWLGYQASAGLKKRVVTKKGAD